MPIQEVIDRYTISRLKLERLQADQCDHEEMRRQVDYYREGIDFSHDGLKKLVDDLYEINGRIWDAEHDIRKGVDDGLGLDEIGRRALIIRDINKQRIFVKNMIVDLLGTGFHDVKMNYV